jgi:DNA-directed RNA polymerase III subunit RPC3
MLKLQHSIVAAIPVEAPSGRPRTTTSCGSNTGTKQQQQQQPQLLYKYKIDASRARLLIRYPRFIEYTKRSHDETAAAIIQELLVHGRMTVQDIVIETQHTLQASLIPSTADLKEEEPSSVPSTTMVKDEKNTDTKPSTTGALTSETSCTVKKETYDRYVTIVEALKNLVEGGYIEMVKPLQQLNSSHDLPSRKSEGSNVGTTSGQKRKLNEFPKEERAGNQNDTDVVENILKSGNYHQRLFPPGSVWRVNVLMFHAVLRAFAFGRLVAERFGNKIDSAGSIVSSALKFAAYQKYSPISPTAAMDETGRLETIGMFCAEDILHFLPSPVLHSFKNKPGGATANLSRVLIQLAQQSHPKVVNEVESSRGHAQGGIFEVSVRQILLHLQRRTLHQYITDAHGEIASRIYSILEAKGYLEAESVADAAMVPVKEAREVLYDLFQAKLIMLVNLQQGKQHNAATSIYLWGVDCSKTTQSVTDYIALALHNIRLRRQHEMEVGKDWVERAKEPSADENEHDLDKLNYNKFCQGLERLDSAAVQLDETLMVMRDFSIL